MRLRLDMDQAAIGIDAVLRTVTAASDCYACRRFGGDTGRHSRTPKT
jgi:hypothetical protein